MKTVNEVLDGDQADDPQAQSLRVAEAYAAVFSGRGSREDAELVLIDLALFTRYYDTTSLLAAAEQALSAAQRRAVLQRVLEGITFGGGDVDGLLSAALRSPPIDVNEETQE